MSRVFLSSPQWFRALNPAERLTSLPAAARESADRATGRRRCEHWKSQTGSPTDGEFRRRLECLGITEHELHFLLEETPAEIRARIHETPYRYERLIRIYRRRSTSFSFHPPESIQTENRAGFLKIVEPLIEDAFDRFDRGIRSLVESHPNPPFDPAVIRDIMFRGVPGQLVGMVSRVLVLELHIARIEGRLAGGSSEQRFDHFIDSLSHGDTALAILESYPVLARQLLIQLDTWVMVSLELLTRLVEDWNAIRGAFPMEIEPGNLVELETGAGDPHRGGRTVAIVTFQSGFKIVYKPRSPAVDIHFQELLGWLNRKGRDAIPTFRTLAILDRGSHGWFEFVHAEPCHSAGQISRFYTRQGGYLALLYALEANDFHHENLIAAGEHPVLVDLESLFQPRFTENIFNGADLLATDSMGYSVLRVGLLPLRIQGDADHEGVDLSGFGSPEGQLTPQPVPKWKEGGTDRMRFARERIPMKSSQNRPMLEGREIDVMDYTGEILAGFSRVYRLILENRRELLHPDGPLARCARDEIRTLFRPTRTYALLFQESFHPDVLRDALYRDRLFDKLWQREKLQPCLEQVIPHEKKDLERGDVPMFTTRPDSVDVWSSRGERISTLFDTSGLDLVRQRLESMGPEDLKRQTWFTRAALSTLALSEEHLWMPSYAAVPDAGEVRTEEWLEAARAIGDHLETLAFKGENDAAWLGVTLERDRLWSLMPLGPDFYGGLAGIAFFLAYLGKYTREEKFTVLADAALQGLFRQLEEAGDRFSSIGGFMGRGGVIYALSHLAALWQRDELLHRAEDYVVSLPELIDGDEALDLLSGSAGCIGGLLSLYRCLPSPAVLEMAVRCGNRILEKAVPYERSLGWPLEASGPTPLAGFSHGAAGMAWALLELAVATGDERFENAAHSAMEYERGVFSEEEGNWPDLREGATIDPKTGQPRNPYMVAWCHGAVGIGLARLQALRHREDPLVRFEAETAVRTTRAHGVGNNHSLCHGDLGNLDLLLAASRAWADQAMEREAYRLAGRVLANVKSKGWLCGVPLGVETPDLMNGLAGIGHGFLRLADPEHMPSPLVMEPPCITFPAGW